MTIEKIDYMSKYNNQETSLKGLLIYNDNLQTEQKKPVIIVIHDWAGRSDFALSKAKSVAELGYASFVIDLYGEAKCANTDEEKLALLKPLVQNRALLKTRLDAAISTLIHLQHPQINTQKIGAVGFCLGGLCVLDLARNNTENLIGVVSFHGILNPPEYLNMQKLPPIRSKILALHGYDDPMVSPPKVMTFSEEMTQRQADWQLVMYSNTTHAFTNPSAQNPASGKFYNALSDQRSWQAMKNFF